MAVVLEKTPTNDGPRTDIQKEYIDVESDRDRGAPESSHEGTEPGVTTKTWVVIFCLTLGFGLTFFPVALMGAVQSTITAELGDPIAAYWLIPSWSLASTVAFMLGGANTDLLGRRWFLIAGNVFGFIGHIVIGTARTGTAAIAGMTVIGFGAGLCEMATFALPELLPNKWRHVGVTLADMFNSFLIIIGPITGRYGVATNTWRWNFYACAIASVFAFLAMYFLYYPPAHPMNLPASQVLKELDYVGAILFIVGSILILMGVVWTTQYTGADVHIIAPICVGFLVLVSFGLWETYGNAKHPLTPPAIFKSGHGRDFTAPVIAVFITNMYFYSQNILWPSMIGAFWSEGDADWHYANALSIVQGGSCLFGCFCLIFLGRPIRHWRYQLPIVNTIMVVFGALGSLAAPQRKSMMIAFAFISGTCFTWSLFLVIAVSQLGVEHKLLGVAGGLAGTFRMSGGIVATSVYTAILSRKETDAIAKLIPAAAVKAGLPVSELPAMMATIGTPELASNYKPAVVAAVSAAYQLAQQQGIRLVALSSIGFGIVGIIACCFCKDVDAKMNNHTEVFLENDVNAGLNKVH